MITLHPIATGKQTGDFPLVPTIIQSCAKNGLDLQNNDVLAISSKFIALSEGNIVKLADVKVSPRAKRIAKKEKMSPEMVQLVLNESEKVFNGVFGFLLAVKQGMIAPNAGIDRSNIYPGYAILYPQDPFASAERIRHELRQATGKNIAIVITDSRLMPTRIGTTGVAVSVAGLEPVADCRGHKDLFGNTLTYTQRALADDIAAAAELLMGEANEAIPAVLIRAQNPPWKYTTKKVSPHAMSMAWQNDLYICGLRKNKPKK